MAKKKGRGRPKSLHKTVRSGYRFTEKTANSLDELVTSCQEAAPDFVGPNQRMVLEAIIQYAKREFDEGRLSYGELFGVPAGVSADRT